MLDILRKIVQEVDSAPTLLIALDVIVDNVQEALKTEVSSVYLLDERSNRYVLMATRGLNPDAVGVVSLGLSEGLVGSGRPTRRADQSGRSLRPPQIPLPA
jgi:phosphotransferase system enzyme I (PtsP)